jgi:hypothetical protein
MEALILNKQELIADIRNKLQAPMTALELLRQGKDVPKELIELAKRELSEAVGMLKDMNLDNK